MEIWKSLNGVVENGDNYEVSNFGEIRNLKGKIIKPEILKKGYLRVGLCLNSKNKKYLVHRLVALAFIPNPESKPEVNHKDGNKQNCKVNNLEWSTSKENINHARENGLNNNHGENHKDAKLTNEDVELIRELYKNKKYYQHELAKMYNVTQRVINCIVNYKTWKHI